MKFKVLRGSPRKGGWCPSPAPRELGFESRGRHRACLGATLTAASSPEGQLPWSPENLAPVCSTDSRWGAGRAGLDGEALQAEDPVQKKSFLEATQG